MNSLFTYIFIIELSMKLIAVGPNRYLSDKMNYMDGGVVIMSIIELVINSISTEGKGGGSSLSAFRTIRIFRTFRVLRVARLLRALDSMQMIIAVIQKSIMQFVYISLLMILFIFIFALLGMQFFGGKFNFEEGVPRSNFDTFNNAFVTSF
jgi:voltage-dependent calcium channel L type alpha-1D